MISDTSSFQNTYSSKSFLFNTCLLLMFFVYYTFNLDLCTRITRILFFKLIVPVLLLLDFKNYNNWS